MPQKTFDLLTYDTKFNDFLNNNLINYESSLLLPTKSVKIQSSILESYRESELIHSMAFMTTVTFVLWPHNLQMLSILSYAII